ncbi:Ubiquitin carboxyl-terminal hydrolase 16 [Stylophora pistillata]|uniref:ubiquitinyl hydrolase 1 n=1 Tax=Stylophora pistillata TaxID=50429 RepID=A0A2B4SMP5_STYPI|nr:Ubiquitin carboxyl-terminal hydrolase 16 [Stylophora pistillata]
MAKGKRNSLKKKKKPKGTDEVQNGEEDEDVKTCPHIPKAVKLNCLQNKVPHTSLGQCLGCDRNSQDKHALSHHRENPSHSIVVHLQNWVVWSELASLSSSEQLSSLQGMRFPVTRRHFIFAAFVTILLAADYLKTSSKSCWRADDMAKLISLHRESAIAGAAILSSLALTPSLPVALYTGCYACDDEVQVEPESSVQKCIKLLLKAMNLSPPAELEPSLSSQDKVSTEKLKRDGSKANNQLKSQIKGLANLGNTCFFNSVMQNLCQTELLHVAASCAAQEGFSYHVTPNDKDLPQLKLKVEDPPGEVTKALWKLLQDFRTSTDRTLTPRQLFSEICKKATRFKGYRQQDSQELLRYLLDSIRNEELWRVKRAVLHSFGVKRGANGETLDDNKRKQVKEYGASAAAPLIDSVFAGRLVSIVTCHQCHQEFKVEETFLDLSLPLASPPQDFVKIEVMKIGKLTS